MEKVRLDKWLWAARFFRTRAKAKEAIEGGKVNIRGSKGKPAKEVQLEDQLTIRQGWDEKTVIVKGLSDQRRRASEAQLLYEETPESVARRTLEAERRKAAGLQISSPGRPDKKKRRQIHQFREKNLR